ncbi:MAG: metal-dependent hydrolase [bacterium]
MDTVTHSMTGFLMGASAARKKDNLYAALLTGVLASVLLDADSLLQVWDYGLYVRYHRLFTHNLPVAPLFALLASLPAWRWVRDRYLFYYLIAFSSILVHLIMDMVCSWPLLLFYPFSKKDFALNWVGFTSNTVLLTVCVLAVAVLWLRHKGQGGHD